MRRSFHPALLLSLLAACRSGVPKGDGTIVVAWSGSTDSASRGTFAAAATARWCASDTLLEVIAVRNDTAVGFALVAQDSARAAQYPVNQARTWTPGRPQSQAGLRWLGTLQLNGYEGYAGTVVVSAGDSRRVTGTIDVRLRPLIGKDSLRLTGQFTGLSIEPAVPPCGRADRPGKG